MDFGFLVDGNVSYGIGTIFRGDAKDSDGIGIMYRLRQGKGRTRTMKDTLVLMVIVLTLAFGVNLAGQSPAVTPTPSPEPTDPTEKLFAEGNDLFDQGTVESLVAARAKFDAMKLVCEQRNDDDCRASALFFLGRTVQLLGEYDNALAIYRDVLVLSRKLKNAQYELISLNNMGLIYSTTGDTRKAVELFEEALKVNQIVHNAMIEGTILNNLGKAYIEVGDGPKAIDLLERAYKICSDGGFIDCASNALINLGADRYQVGDNRKALDFFNRALELNSKSIDKRTQATVLANIGKIYADLDDFQNADASLTKALAIAQSTGFKQVEAAALNSLGEIRGRRGMWAEAIDFFNRSLIVSRADGAMGYEATTLLNLANAYLRTGDNRKAIEYIEPAIQIASRFEIGDLKLLLLAIRGMAQMNIGEPENALASAGQAESALAAVTDRSIKANATYFIGVTYAQLGETQRALDLLGQSVELSRSISDQSLLASVLNYLGLLNLQLGKTSLAIANANAGLAIADTAQDKPNQALSNIVLGRAYSGSDPKRALEYFENGLHIAESAGSKSLQAYALSRIGEVYFILGQPQRTVEYLNLALPIEREVGDKLNLISSLNLRGLVYSTFGQPDKALEFAEQALSIARALKSKGGEAIVLNTLAKIYLSMDKREKTIELATDALKLARSVGDRSTEAGSLSLLGVSFQMTGESEKAIDNFNRMATICDEIGDRSGEILAFSNIGYHYWKAGDNQKAIEYFNRALVINTGVKFRGGQALLASNMMVLMSEMGNPGAAVYFGKQAVNIYQEYRTSLRTVDDVLQKSFAKSVESTYRILADILIAKGRISEAEQVLAMLKEEEAFTFLRREDKVARNLMQTASLTAKEREALTRYDALGDRITLIGKELNDLERERTKYDDGKFPNQARYDELKAEAADARVAFQKFLDELKVKFGQRDERVAAVDSSIQNTLRRLKATRTAVVSTIVGEGRLNLIVTTAGVQRAHTVDISEKEINSLVAEFRQALTNPKVDPRPSGQKLYDVLVKPIEGDLKGVDADTILWSLDGTLRYIPTAALWDKEKGYLAERFASVILTLASRETLTLPVTGKQNWQALGVGVSKATEGFVALKAVPDELDCIITDAQSSTVSLKPLCRSGVVNGKKLLDEKFTRAAFENAIGRYPLVHIASHFSLNPGNDMNSFLLLGGGEPKRFTVEDLRGLSLTDVELMVLSACNTATPGGEQQNGVEIEQFGAVAQKHGAKAVMATLWSVMDDSTREWMVKFYETYEKQDMSKAEAMRQTQVAMMYGKYKPAEKNTRRSPDSFTLTDESLPVFKEDANAPYSHPYYWSPFVLFGNWK